jgi:hypothetical protein
LKSRVPVCYTVGLIGGVALGLLFGHMLFKELEVGLRDPLADILLSLFGALSAAALYELVALILRPG